MPTYDESLDAGVKAAQDAARAAVAKWDQVGQAAADSAASAAAAQSAADASASSASSSASSAAASAALVGAPAKAAMDAAMGGDVAGLVPAVAGKVSKGSLVFNVKDYGATGDGTTDDRAAIQSAIDAANAAGGGVVYFPPGVYIVGSTGSAWNLKLKSGVTVRGSSRSAVTIRQKVGAIGSERVFSSYTGASNVCIESLTIDGQGASQTVDEHRHAIFLTSSSNVTIRDLEIYGMTGGGVSLYTATTDVTIQNCNIHDVMRGAVEFTGGDTYRVRVLNNTLSIPSGNGGQVVDGEVEATGNGHADAVVIEGNSLTNLNNGYALSSGTASGSARNASWVIANNTIVGAVTLLRTTGARFTGNNVTVVSGALPGVVASITTDALVHGNTVTTPTTAVGISAEFTLSISPVRLTVTGNTINSGYIGMSLKGAQQARVIGNVFIGSGTASAPGVNMQATTTTRDITIENNTFLNFNPSAVAVSTFSTNTIEGLAVRYNNFRDDQGAATMVRGVDVTGAASQMSSLDIRGNISVGVTTPYRDATTSGPAVLVRSVGGAMRETQGSAAPTAGTWAVGDRCWNVAPTPSGTMGWVCTTAGTPGTWKTFGAISA